MTRLILLLLFVCCLTLATVLQPIFMEWHNHGTSHSSMLAALMGDSRRLFANEFFAKADAYFHSGYYPTIFDHANREETSDLVKESHEKHDPDDHDESFLGKPQDWVERFGRNFFPTVHTHLQGTNAQEILPWLKLSADLDPNRVETYVVASYWLRTRLNKPLEAETFLRQGLRANPDSYEILLELGRIYFYNKKDPHVARNLWEMALKKWHQQDQAGEKPDAHTYEEILGELVRADKQIGDVNQMISDLEALKVVSPNKAGVQKYIDDAKAPPNDGKKSQ